MKKIVKSLGSLIFILFIFANNAYASTQGVVQGTYTVSESSSSVGKIVLFLIAVCLVTIVLFVGYKMDVKEISDERRKKILSNLNKRPVDDEYQEESEENEEFNELYDNEENKSTLDEDINIVDDEDLIENILEESIIVKVDDDDSEVVAEPVEEEKNEDMAKTGVFDSSELRTNEDIAKEDEEFLELLELEKTIAAAKVKRYTRKRVSNRKRYTRKIEVEKPAPKKRGRKPKVRTEEELAEIARRALEPKKRGRKPGSKNKPKVIEPKKRGRKPGSKNKPKVLKVED